MFPNYIKNIQNDKNINNKKSNQNYKRYHHIKNNLSAKIPVQFYNDEIKNNRNNKISLVIYKNDGLGVFSNENKKKIKA